MSLGRSLRLLQGLQDVKGSGAEAQGLRPMAATGLLTSQEALSRPAGGAW